MVTLRTFNVNDEEVTFLTLFTLMPWKSREALWPPFSRVPQLAYTALPPCTSRGASVTWWAPWTHRPSVSNHIVGTPTFTDSIVTFHAIVPGRSRWTWISIFTRVSRQASHTVIPSPAWISRLACGPFWSFGPLFPWLSGCWPIHIELPRVSFHPFGSSGAWSSWLALGPHNCHTRKPRHPMHSHLPPAPLGTRWPRGARVTAVPCAIIWLEHLASFLPGVSSDALGSWVADQTWKSKSPT